jgi:hypothetical protein
MAIPVTGAEIGSLAATAKYALDARVAADCRPRCAVLLGRHPLYQAVQL